MATNREDALAGCQVQELMELDGRKARGQQVHVIQPDEARRIAVVHDWMKARQQERVHKSRAASVWTK
jgi:hypothetical protein